MSVKTPRPFHVVNSKGHVREAFQPITPGKVTLYSCGPTVYGLIHIGNLRAAITADLFYRTLKKFGYEVNFIRNYTDVDDKIIQKAASENSTSDLIAKKYISEVERDYLAAGLAEPTRKTLVTDHMPEIISMIESIIKNNHGYVADDGEVLFSVESYERYGSLSGKKKEDLLEGMGHRVAVTDKKKSGLDFTLWKPAKPGEPSWDSPWGKGRPGWHIECSAMSSKWFGPSMDIHHGGTDLIFPHHENEIAQSECATHEHPYVRYWLHSAMLNIQSEKMSKSLGNVVTARDFLTEFGGEITRYFLLSVHYRSVADFSEEALGTTYSSLARIYEAKEKAQELLKLKAALPDPRAEAAWGSFLSSVEKAKTDFLDQMANDFNTPGALAVIFTLIRDWNRTIAEPRATGTPAAVLAAQEFISFLESDVFDVLGIGRANPRSVLDRIRDVKLKRSGGSVTDRPDEAWILSQIEARKAARAAKDFAAADDIRKAMLAKGVAIKDSPQGTTWEYV